MPRLADSRQIRIRVHGLIVAFVAAVALAGHLLDMHELANWFSDVPMAIPTAFCFLLLGASDIELSIAGHLWPRSPAADV